jgi:hypothetical protein
MPTSPRLYFKVNTLPKIPSARNLPKNRIEIKSRARDFLLPTIHAETRKLAHNQMFLGDWGMQKTAARTVTPVRNSGHQKLFGTGQTSRAVSILRGIENGTGSWDPQQPHFHNPSVDPGCRACSILFDQEIFPKSGPVDSPRFHSE